MSWGALYFLSEPWFVVPWYAIGALAMLYVIYDLRTHNTVLKPAMSWAWPIIVFFFSVIGLALYFGTARAPGIGERGDRDAKTQAHHQFEEKMWRRVNGAVIHCVAGDGFGIMTGMVIARAGGLNPWQEFWFEYLVGFAIGWFIFQRKSMTMMTDSLTKQLALAFRGEFFSMLTVMGGMGAVMTYVTPLVATAQPAPLTAAFWGFGMFGLLAGFVFTFPTNWLMVKLGWKHGMGGMQAAKAHEVTGAKRYWLVAALMVYTGFGLFVPAWLTEVREGAARQQTGASLAPAGDVSIRSALYTGLEGSLHRAISGLTNGHRSQATVAMDASLRAAEVGAHSAPGAFYSALEQIRAARTTLQQGDESGALALLQAAASLVERPTRSAPVLLEVGDYRGAVVIDGAGTMIGEVTRASSEGVVVALGGWRDVWGIFDFGAKRRVHVPVRELAYGLPRAIGSTLVALPTQASELTGVAPPRPRL